MMSARALMSIGFGPRAQCGTNPQRSSAALIPTEPNELVGSVHDRMPALLTADDLPAWLDSTSEDPAVLLPLLRPTTYDVTDMESWPVSKFVSKARNEAPECIDPLAH
jgi:putative SOS response-associated peptidase YedK